MAGSRPPPPWAPDRRAQATPKPLVPGMVHSKSRGVAKARPDDLDGGAMRTRLMETHPKAPPPKIPKTAKPFEGHCRYFNFGKSPDGCQFGASCKFSHVTEDNWDEIGKCRVEQGDAKFVTRKTIKSSTPFTRLFLLQGHTATEQKRRSRNMVDKKFPLYRGMRHNMTTGPRGLWIAKKLGISGA